MEQFANSELSRTLEQAVGAYTQEIEQSLLEKIAFYQEQLQSLYEFKSGLLQSLANTLQNQTTRALPGLTEAPSIKTEPVAPTQIATLDAGLKRIKELAEQLQPAPVPETTVAATTEAKQPTPVVVKPAEDVKATLLKRHYQGPQSVFADYLSGSVYAGGRGDISYSNLTQYEESVGSVSTEQLLKWPAGFYTSKDGDLELLLVEGPHRFILTPLGQHQNEIDPIWLMAIEPGAMVKTTQVPFSQLSEELLLKACQACELALQRLSPMAQEPKTSVATSGLMMKPDDLV